MRSLLKSSAIILLAAVLLVWTSVCAAGLVTQCSGSGDGPCEIGAVHFHPAVVLDDCTNHEHEHDCGCPEDHEHSALPTEMARPAFLAVLPPLLWTMESEFLLPSLIPAVLEETGKPVAPSGSPPPGPPPPFLACGPLLV